MNEIARGWHFWIWVRRRSKNTNEFTKNSIFKLIFYACKAPSFKNKFDATTKTQNPNKIFENFVKFALSPCFNTLWESTLFSLQ